MLFLMSGSCFAWLCSCGASRKARARCLTTGHWDGLLAVRLFLRWAFALSASVGG